jgi:hypothetical protein
LILFHATAANLRITWGPSESLQRAGALLQKWKEVLLSDETANQVILTAAAGSKRKLVSPGDLTCVSLDDCYGYVGSGL